MKSKEATKKKYLWNEFFFFLNRIDPESSQKTHDLDRFVFWGSSNQTKQNEKIFEEFKCAPKTATTEFYPNNDDDGSIQFNIIDILFNEKVKKFNISLFTSIEIFF